MPKISIVYVIYNKNRQKDGSINVKLRFTFNRRPAVFSTSIFVQEDDLVKQRPGEENKAREIKNLRIRRKVEDLIREYEDAANEFDPYLFPDWTVTEVAKYLDKIVHKDSFRLSFVEFGNKFIEIKDKSSHQAALNYKAALSSFCEFLGVHDFDISRITSAKMREYENWLKEKFGDNARAVSLYTSSIAAIHKAARLKFNSEELDELNIKNPFEYYKPPKQPKAQHRNLEPGIIQGMIDNYPSLKGQERLAIGAFLLSFALMGMNTPDLYECLYPDKGVIHYFRHKTRSRREDKAEMYIKIPECIAPLWEEYSDKSKKRAFNFHFRYSSFKNMEDAEKDGMAKYKKRIGFDGRLTMYSARHTWATIARSAKCNVPMSVIDDCLVHVGQHQVGDVYAKKDYTVLWNANETVLSQLCWAPLQH